MAWERAPDLKARMKDLREGLRMLQQEFAEVVGVTPQSISDYETGRSKPSRGSLERLARKLGIPVAGFAKGGPMPSTLLRSPAGARNGAGAPSGGSPVASEPTEAYIAHLKIVSGVTGWKALRLLEIKMEAAELEGRMIGRDEILEWLRLARAAMEPGEAASG